MSHELPNVQGGFRKGRGTRYEIANTGWVVAKAKEVQKTSISSLLTISKPLTLCITVKCGKF